MHDNPDLEFIDHSQLHEQGECAEQCPWCVEEMQDLGGEG